MIVPFVLTGHHLRAVLTFMSIAPCMIVRSSSFRSRTALVLQLDVLDHFCFRVYSTDTVSEQLVEHRLQRYRDGRQHDHDHVHNG